MKKLLIYALILFIDILPIHSQTVSNVNFWQKGQKIEIKYDLIGAKYYQYFNIEVYVSTDAGKTYQGPLQQVSGEVGPDIKEGVNKIILWDVFKELPTFQGDVLFIIRATVMKTKIKHRPFIGYKASYTAPFGFVAGLTGKTGFYVSARINQHYFETSAYETDGVGIIDYNEPGYYTFLSKDKTQRLSVTAGLQFQVGWKVHLYLGGGIAQYNLLWQIEQYDYPSTFKGNQWVKHKGESFNSFEIETGMMLQFNHFFISAGAAAPNFEWADFTLSAGVVF
jgi:opacity protein-like surface antigen